MKKIFLLTIILLIAFMAPAFAEEKNDEAVAAQKVIDSIKEIRYAVKAGTSFNNYSNLVSVAAIEYERFKDKYPNSQNYQANMAFMVIKPYKDAESIWGNTLARKYRLKNFLAEDELNYELAAYPKLRDEIKANATPEAKKMKYYYYTDVIRGLWQFAQETEQRFANPQ